MARSNRFAMAFENRMPADWEKGCGNRGRKTIFHRPHSPWRL